jgi:putative colanic acid biosynthesis glycosyltransferase WcaI
MHILLPIIQFPPDVNPTGLLMAQLCEGLITYGHEVSVITAFPHYENFRIWNKYKGKLVEHSRYRDMDVVRLYVYAPGNKSMVNRLFSYVSYNALAAMAGASSRSRWDVILCPNGSFFSGLSAWFIGKLKAAPFIYNVQDLYPDVPIRAGQLRNRYAIAALKSMEAFMYRKAAHITVISPTMRDSLLSKGVPPEKITVIPNFVDTDFIRPLPKKNDFSLRHGLADKFVVTYAGNLGYVYDLETLLDAASLLSKQKDVIFLIVGNGVAKPALEKKASELKLANVRFLPFQPREDLPWLRASSDVQVSLYKNGAANDSFPSKIYEIMASGRPLLASSEGQSGIENLVQDVECGVCVRPGDAEQLAQAILHLHCNSSLRETMGRHGRQYAEEHYSKNAAVMRYHELLENISAQNISH